MPRHSRVRLHAGCLWLAVAAGCNISTNQFAGLQACQDDTECPFGATCHPDGVCLQQSCETPLDCGESLVALACVDGTCVGVSCDETVACMSGYVCESGFCVACLPSGAEGPAGDDNCTDDIDNDCDAVRDAMDPDCMPACLVDADCSNGDPCDGDEVCQGNACAGGIAVDCSNVDDPFNCVVGVCNSANGVCEAHTTPDGGPCSDGVFCTVGESCAAGICQSGETNLCTEVIDACNSAICDEEAGACVAVPVICALDTNPCTLDCDPSIGCNAPAPDGTACEAGEFCTSGDSCLLGNCTEGSLNACDDEDDCTLDTCSEEYDLCTYVPDLDLLTEGLLVAGTCDDAIDNDCDGQVDSADIECNTCTGNNDCSDGNFCTNNVCEDGSCTNPGRVDGIDCNDDDPCTSGDSCSDGVCVGTPATCDGDL